VEAETTQMMEEEEAVDEQDQPAEAEEEQYLGCFAGCTPVEPPSPAGLTLATSPTLSIPESSPSSLAPS